MQIAKHGNVTLELVSTPQRGTCLCASDDKGKKILMDVCGMNPMLVPDGTNAYMFANKLLLVTRWSDMTDEEKVCVQNESLILAVHPLGVTQFSLRIHGNWGDVFWTLPNCVDWFNDPDLPVTEVIFVFCDTHDSDFIITRAVELPPFVGALLKKSNAYCLENCALNLTMDQLKEQAEEGRDEYDVLYDRCFELTDKFGKQARKENPSYIPNGIYMLIDEQNKVAKIKRAQSEPESEPMSQEVKTYLETANSTVPGPIGDNIRAEAMYNLGVSYEQGDGVAQNYEKAAEWYKKSADLGFAKAQYNLGVLYYNGMGVPVDYDEMIRLYTLSANQGDMYAWFNLGVCYYKGTGVEQNQLTAIECFMNAAEMGHPEAKRILGM